jgi:hypothetical protein
MLRRELRRETKTILFAIEIGQREPNATRQVAAARILVHDPDATKTPFP